MSHRSHPFLTTITLGLLVSACASVPRANGVDAGLEWDFRTVDPAWRQIVTPARLMERLAAADVIIFGEQHDDRETHRAQRALLDALGRIGRPIVLSLEMFERDVQTALDDYLAGRITEADFLARTRPWGNYATDYRPLVELARERGWPVIAANVPRPIASAIGRRGLAALDGLAPAERARAARDIACPDDDYRTRFLEQMRSHSPGSGGAPSPGDTLPTAMAERFYLAQCVKDETMAESITAAMREAPGDAIVYHVTGAFHSDYHEGIVPRVRRRAPAADVVVVVGVPVADPRTASLAPHTGRADFVIFTRRASQPR